MAKLKKNVRAKSGASKPRSAKSNPDLQAKAEQMSRSLVESAQQIWMAGVGAFTRAQGEGSKLFEALVKEGMTIEQTTRKLATGKVDAVRDAVEDRVGVVRERAVLGSGKQLKPCRIQKATAGFRQHCLLLTGKP